MTGQVSELFLHLDAQSEDDEELAEITQQLREELLELDVEAVDLVGGGEAPAKAKAGDPISLGMLLVTLAASGGVLTSLINVLQSWLGRQERRSLTLKIGDDELAVTGISSEEQQRLIDAWLSRHSDFTVANE